jgi:preprotein translocase subunit SecA
MNKQRTAVYDMRRMILEGKDTREHVLRLIQEVLEWYMDSYCPDNDREEAWAWESVQGALKETFGIEPPLAELRAMGRQEMLEHLARLARERYEEREKLIGVERALFHQRMIMLQIVDTQWKDHLYSLDHLKEGIGLRGYGQRDPLVEYKKESYQMFQALMDRIDEEILRWTFLYQPVAGPQSSAEREAAEVALRGRSGLPAGARLHQPQPALAGAGAGGATTPTGRAARGAAGNLSFNDPSAAPGAFSRSAQPREAEGGHDAKIQTVRREGRKVGRNDPCPCGSGKKYKKCHGK